MLQAIRPYIRYVDSSRYIDDLANGEICLALGWSGDMKQAHDRAAEAGKGIDVAYSIPKEGAIVSFDMLAIPADAPHPKNAHLFINFLLRPEVAAQNSNLIKYANGVTRSLQPLDAGGAQRSGHLSAAGGAREAGRRSAPTRRIHAPADAHVDALQDRQMTAPDPS